MKPVTLPVDVDDDVLGALDLSESELIERFGPGVLPTLEMFTLPGPIRAWPLSLDDGQIVLITHALGVGETLIYANPKDVERAVAGLGLSLQRLIWRP